MDRASYLASQAAKAALTYDPQVWKLAVSGCINPVGAANAFENCRVMSVRAHAAIVALKDVRIVYSNWANIWLSDGGDDGGYGGTSAGWGNITFNGSVCYPDKATIIGTFSGSVQPGEDAIVLCSLSAEVPAGGIFYVATYGVPDVGCGIPIVAPIQGTTSDSVSNLAVNSSLGEAAEFSTSTTDKTGNPSTVTGNTSNTWGPTAILAMQSATTPVVALHGDSRGQGYYVAADDYNNNGWVGAAFGKSVAFMNYSASAKPAFADAGVGNFGYGDGMKFRRAHAKLIGVTHVIVDLGRNDAYGYNFDSEATILAHLREIQSKWQADGYQVWFGTQLPDSTSTDNWATIANQTPGTYHSVVDSLNAAIRAGISGAAGYIDGAAAAGTALTGGVWKVPLLTPDGTHPANNAKAMLSAVVPLSAFSATLPASAVAIADTYALGLHSVQQGLDFAIKQSGNGAVYCLTTDADLTYTPFANGRKVRDAVSLTADRKLTLSNMGAVDGLEVRLSRPGSLGGHHRAVYQSDGTTLIKTVADSAYADFIWDENGGVWYESGAGQL